MRRPWILAVVMLAFVLAPTATAVKYDLYHTDPAYYVSYMPAPCNAAVGSVTEGWPRELNAMMGSQGPNQAWGWQCLCMMACKLACMGF